MCSGWSIFLLHCSSRTRKIGYGPLSRSWDFHICLQYLTSPAVTNAASLPTFEKFRIGLQGMPIMRTNNVHDGVHLAVGGEMSNFYSSPAGQFQCTPNLHFADDYSWLNTRSTFLPPPCQLRSYLVELAASTSLSLIWDIRILHDDTTLPKRYPGFQTRNGRLRPMAFNTRSHEYSWGAFLLYLCMKDSFFNVQLWIS